MSEANRRGRVISAQVDDATAYRLARIAAASDRTISQELRRAVREHLATAEETERLHTRFGEAQR